jgi:hypothetical protein
MWTLLCIVWAYAEPRPAILGVTLNHVDWWHCIHVQHSILHNLALQVFELPSVLAYPLFYKLVAPEASLVGRAAMQAWIIDKQLVSLDVQSRMMEVCCPQQGQICMRMQRLQLRRIGPSLHCTTQHLSCTASCQLYLRGPRVLTVATLLLHTH